MAFFFSWGLAGTKALVVAVGQVMVLGSNVFLLCLFIMMQIKLLNSIKTESTLSRSRISL